MAWIVGIYLAWGVFKVLCLLGEKEARQKPMWMYTEKNPLKRGIFFTGAVLLWPFIKVE